MPDPALTQVVSQVTRLLHKRSSTPRPVALGTAYRLIHRYAVEHGLTETWCDRVLLMFIKGADERLAQRAA